MRRQEKQSGITLIALVVTIIVIIILGTLSITLIFGDYGVVSRSQYAREKTNYIAAKEKIELELANVQILCSVYNVDYDLEKIAREFKLTSEITIENYFNSPVAMIKNGVSENYVNLEAIVVTSKMYENFKFLIATDCSISGVSVKSEPQKEDFINTEYFEENVLGIRNEENTVESNGVITISASPDKREQELEDSVTVNIDVEYSEDITYSRGYYAWKKGATAKVTNDEWKTLTLNDSGDKERTGEITSQQGINGSYYLWIKVIINGKEEIKKFGVYNFAGSPEQGNLICRMINTEENGTKGIVEVGSNKEFQGWKLTYKINNSAEVEIEQETTTTLYNIVKGDIITVKYSKQGQTDVIKTFNADELKVAYILKYNANGGDYAPADQVQYDNNVITITTEKPTKDNNIFDGWYENAEGTGTKYTEGNTITVNTANREITLYAHWVECISVSFDANGGSGTMEDIVTGANVDIAYPTNTMTRTGYDFIGWNTEPDGSGTNYAEANKDTTQISIGEEDITLYAQWQITNYSITYTLNGGTATNPASYTIETNDFTLVNPTKDGYIFTGWSGTEIQGTSTSVTISRGSTGTRSYTANWEQQPYSASFEITPNEGWQKEVSVSINTSYNKANTVLKYRIGTTGEFQEYAGEFVLSENTTLFGQSYNTLTGEIEYAFSEEIDIIDKIKPTVNIVSREVKARAITVNVNSIDNQIGMPNIIEYKFYKSTDGENYTLVDTENTGTYTYTDLSPSTEYYIKVTAEDKAGNEGKIVERITTTDEISVSKITLNKTSITVGVNKTFQLETTSIVPSNATDKTVTWKSSNTSVATVSASGLVTGKQSGTATITCESTDKGASKTCSVKVVSGNLIYTASDLQNNITNKTGTYYLMDDIDLTGINWTSIAYNDANNNFFMGTFEGNGYQISNLNAPLFNKIGNGAKIRNVKINANINKSDTEIGALCKNIPTSSTITISNVAVTGTIKGQGYVGGLVGKGSGSCTVSVTNCYVTANLYNTSSTYDCAGLICKNTAGSANYSFTDCYFAGTINGATKRIGTFTSGNNSNVISGTTLTRCYYDSTKYSTTITTGVGTPLTTANFAQQSSFPSQWNFTTTWKMVNSRPELRVFLHDDED